MNRRPLARIIEWGHELLGDVVAPGDFVVDLTAGTGQDTLFLYRLVGSAGRVVAFDIQAQALTMTRERLLAAGAVVRVHENSDSGLSGSPGVDLFKRDHAAFADIVSDRPAAIIANLGYLPGGDQQLVTRSESTLAALEQSCRLLLPGGRMAIVAYPGHPGGSAEAEAVGQFMAQLDSSSFQVLRMEVANRPQAPLLYGVEKLQKGGE